MNNLTLDPITRLLGLVTPDSTITAGMLTKIQSWMAMVVAESGDTYWRSLKDRGEARGSMTLPRQRFGEAGHLEGCGGAIHTLDDNVPGDDGDRALSSSLLVCHEGMNEQDNNAGQATRGRKRRRDAEELPPHIEETRRIVIGAGSKATCILRCACCFAELAGHNRRRFIALRAGCLGEKRATCPKRVLTKAEKLAITHATGREYSKAALGTRRKLMRTAML